MNCGHSGRQLVGFCSMGCAHQNLVKRSDHEQTAINKLSQEIFRLTHELRRLRAQNAEALRQDHLVLGWRL